jgi:hypothetical protein
MRVSAHALSADHGMRSEVAVPEMRRPRRRLAPRHAAALREKRVAREASARDQEWRPGLGWPSVEEAHRALLAEIRHRLEARDDPNVTNADGSNYMGRT